MQENENAPNHKDAGRDITRTLFKRWLISNDPQLFAQVYEKFFPKLVAFLTRIVLRQEDAEDIAESTFLKALEHMNTLNFEREPASWMFKVAFNDAMDL